jgi:hypothetical protein
MAGTIVANTINTDTAGAVFTTANAMTGIANAWCNYNGVTQTITNSFNISSVTRNATGDYTFTFTTAMPNANYVINASNVAANSGGAWKIGIVNAQAGSPYYRAPTTTSFRCIWTPNVVSTPDADVINAYVSVFSS